MKITSFAAYLFCLFLWTETALSAPKAVASIRPIHSILTTVMAGVSEPDLLIEGLSPHGASLKPSQARKIQEADLIVWVGPSLESFLDKPLHSIAGDADVVSLLTVDGLNLWPLRDEDGFLGSSDSNHDHDHDHDHEHEGEFNPHIWLDPKNAAIIARYLEQNLSELDPTNAAAYKLNTARFVSELNLFTVTTKSELATAQDRPFLVFHDAYINFEKAFGLKAGGVVALNPEIKLSAKKFRSLSNQIGRGDFECIFSEPQFDGALIQRLAEQSKIKVSSLDPMGSQLELGPKLYLQLMKEMVQAFRQCLIP